MSSTDQETGRTLQALFEGHLLPATERLARSGTRLFPSGPDPVKETYYCERQKKAMRPQDFELDLEYLDDVKTRLERLWGEAPPPEIRTLLYKLLSLAPAYCDKRDAEDVSPFIYVMF